MQSSAPSSSFNFLLNDLVFAPLGVVKTARSTCFCKSVSWKLGNFYHAEDATEKYRDKITRVEGKIISNYLEDVTELHSNSRLKLNLKTFLRHFGQNSQYI